MFRIAAVFLAGFIFILLEKFTTSSLGFDSQTRNVIFRRA